MANSLSKHIPGRFRPAGELEENPIRTIRTQLRIVYVVIEDWYFILHRLTTARAARDAGLEVHVITRADRYGAAIQAEGFHLHPIDWRRGSTRPADVARTLYQLHRLYRRIRPDIVHHVALEAIMLGSLVARIHKIPHVNSLVGLGFVFTSRALKARLLKSLFTWLLPRLVAQANSVLVVENPHDFREMIGLGVAAERMVVIGGAAFEVDSIPLLPEPEHPVTAAFVGRMLEDKGVRTLVQAHRILAERGLPFRLLLAGLPDPANPTSIRAAELEAWSRTPDLQWLGYSDIAKVWAMAHIAVLPSRREGLPQSLLEAAAYGRPIIATDVPGSTEIAQPGVNALLVPIDDAEALAQAIAQLAADPDMRRRYGLAGRRLVEEKFSSASVGPAIVALYCRLLSKAQALPADEEPDPRPKYDFCSFPKRAA